MQKIKPYITKNNIILVLVAIIFLGVVFRGCGKEKPLKIVVTKTVTIKQRVKADEKASAKVIDSLKEREQSLVAKVKSTEKDLKKAERLASELLNDVTIIIDSSGNAELKEKIDYYKIADAVEDSLCRTAINTLGSLNENKDLQIAEHLLLYSKLRNNFNHVVENEGVKDANILILKKQLRKRKAGTIFWKVAAGAAGILILKDRL